MNSIVASMEETMPLLKRWNVDVVSYGPSLHKEQSDLPCKEDPLEM